MTRGRAECWSSAVRLHGLHGPGWEGWVEGRLVAEEGEEEDGSMKQKRAQE